MKDKIKTYEELLPLIEKAKAKGKKIVFTNGCFDILHVGHVRYLKEAKDLGDILIIGLNSDSSVREIKGKKRPIVPENERAEILAALSFVDYITFFSESTPNNLIKLLHPHILVKGGDWEGKEIVGREVVEKDGGRVVTIKEVPGASTTNILKKIRESFR